MDNIISGKFGRYEIKSELARGGMATVYNAYDPKFEREVALKVLPQAFLHDPQFRIRFEREGKVIATLEHPAIVPVYDFGEEDGQPYIVMRLMTGGSLTDRIKQGPLSFKETAEITYRLGQALDAAHERKIIHRDLKPGNILFDQYGNAYLSDFGIARFAGELGATLTGSSIIGTPAYMSPEQIQGTKQIDGRSDIYALGILVFQMLTGERPFQADTAAKLMMMHLMEPVPDINNYRDDLPPGVDILLWKAMEKEPDDRFSRANEFGEAMKAISAGNIPDWVAQAKASGYRGQDSEIRRGKAVTLIGGKPPLRRVSAGKTAPTRANTTSKRGLTFAIIIAVLVIIAFAVGGGLYLGGQGYGLFASLGPPTETATQIATATSAPVSPTSPPPSATEVAILPSPEPATQTPNPTVTATVTETPTPLPTALIIGGADKIAYLRENDLWVANLDGSDHIQLTEDGTVKTGLQWSPGGDAITYISGKCVFTIGLETGRIDIIVCFNFVDYLKSFEVSPDGSQVAISLDNQLYILPYDLEQLEALKRRSELGAMALCEHFAPYERNFVKMASWSRDGNSLAMVIMGVASGIGSADIIQIISMQECTPQPAIIDNFPPPRFRMPAYENAPTIQNFSWNGLSLFVFNTLVRNNGYGDLYVYNMDLHKAHMELNPINDSCCYRDATWSPDGNYLLFAYQDYSAGADALVQFYYIPYGTIGTGTTYEPMALPGFPDLKANPLPILRPAQ